MEQVKSERCAQQCISGEMPWCDAIPAREAGRNCVVLSVFEVDSVP